jgi:hypothetical protein
MMADKAPTPARVTDFLLSWDRLGFRLLVFGGLALAWILQGRLADQSWELLIRSELGGLLPWAFLAPMVLVFVPYWVILRGIALVWGGFALGWDAARLRNLLPTQQNLLGAFLSVPFVYCLILLGAEAMKHARARQEEEIQAGRLAGQLAEARLALLQRQLHPHFLFNALQAISTLIHRDPETADLLLVRLSTLLRAISTLRPGRR